MKNEVVIIGGGFAGLNLVKHLAEEPDFHITLVDMNNYNLFPPLLYQVATGFLEVSNICYPFRKFFHNRSNVSFRLGDLQQIITQDNKVLLSTGELTYDYLVLATGTETSYFGMENIRKAVLPMKTVDDAIEIRNDMIQKMEEATVAANSAKGAQEMRLSVVIVGGGPTGVEIAGMFAEMRENILQKDYPELDGHEVDIYLVDALPGLLTSMSEKSQQYAYDKLIEMGVKVRLNKRVKDYVNNAVIFADGETIKTRILLWTAGVTAKVFDGLPPDCYGRGNRLRVDEHNKVKGMSNIYAIGDTCLMVSDGNFLQGHPQLAQVALQQGKNLAGNLLAGLYNRPLKPFFYRDKGSMAIIGRNKAVADLPKPEMHFNGFVAWMTWLFVHLFSLITYRNRVMTMFNWGIAYFTKDQSLRMIIRPAANPRHEE